MKKTAHITITGIQDYGSCDEQVTETSAECEYALTAGKYIATYKESVEGSDEKLRCIVKFDAHSLEVSKSGPISSRLCFNVKTPYRTFYNTPYGQISLDINTQKITFEDHFGEVTLTVLYTMSMNETEPISYKTTVTLK